MVAEPREEIRTKKLRLRSGLSIKHCTALYRELSWVRNLTRVVVTARWDWSLNLVRYWGERGFGKELF